MKNLNTYVVLIFTLVSTSIFAQPTSSNGSIKEAATKGKAELIKILSESKDFNFGLNARDIEGTEIGNSIEEFTADFNSLASNQTQTLNAITTRSERFIVPLSNDNNVVTTVTVASNGKENKVVEFINQQYTSELNQLPRTVKTNGFSGLRIVIIPNLNAVLYVSDDKCYTTYNGRNLKEPVSVSELLVQIQKDARDFEIKYGEKLRKGMLVR